MIGKRQHALEAVRGFSYHKQLVFRTRAGKPGYDNTVGKPQHQKIYVIRQNCWKPQRRITTQKTLLSAFKYIVLDIR